jgi:hypothetical protein
VPSINSSLVGFPPLQAQSLDGTYASLTANQTISGTNTFTGAVTFSGTLTINGTVNFAGTVNYSGTVNFSGNTNFSGTNIFTTAQINTLSVGTSGTVGALDIYPATSSLGKTRFTSTNNSGNTTTTINVAAQTGARTYTIPDAGLSASYVMTEGAQTLNGVKTLTGSNIYSGATSTFTGTIKAGQSGTAGLIELYPTTAARGKTTFVMADNTGDTTTAFSVAAQSGARTYTTPDAGASASYVMSEGAMTVNGNKAFSGTNTHSGTNTFTSTVKFGQSGTAGAPELYPGTVTSGKTTFTMTDNVGDTTTNVNFASQAGARTYTVPDAGASASYVMTEGAQTINGIKVFTAGVGLPCVDQTTTPVTMLVNKAYSANNAGLVTLNIPATVAVGDTFDISGFGAGGWLLQANTGQTINFGSSATTSAGSLASTNRYDCVKIRCAVANNTFVVISSIGNLTVA